MQQDYSKMTAGAVMILKIIGKSGIPMKKGLLIRHFVGAYDNKMDPHMDALRQSKFILENEDLVNITELGKDYLREYNMYGVEDVKRFGYQYAIINFLRRSNGKVRVSDFPKFLIDSCPTDMTGGSKENDLFHYLAFSPEMRPYLEETNRFFGLSPAGIKLHELENRAKETKKDSPVYELNMLDFGLQMAERREKLIQNGLLAVTLPARNPINQVNKQHKKMPAITIVKSCWELITKNPLISSTIAAIIAYIFLKRFHLL
jgi:hypothetical protein